MPQIKTNLLVIIAGLFFASCTTLQPNQEGSYQDSMSDRKNRAPTSLTPPIVFHESGPQLDPAYNQSQADYNFSLAEGFSIEGLTQKAIEHFKTALIYDPQAYTIKLRLASELLRSGQVSESLALAQEVSKEQPKNEQSLMLLAALYSTLKLYPKAIESYQRVLSINSDNQEASLYLGALLAETKQYDQAIQLFEKLLKSSDDQEHMIHYYLARVHLEGEKKGADKKVEYHLKKAIESKPSFSEALMTLGAFYSSLGQDKKSLKLYEDYQKKYGPSVRIAEVLSQSYLDAEDYDSAYEQLEILELQGGDQLNTKLKMALILVEKKIFDKSIAKFKEILNEVPDSDRARYYLAAVYEQIQDTDKAVVEYKKVPADSSYFNESVIHAAYLLKASQKLPDAVILLEESIKKKEEANFYSLYASFLNEQKKTQKAIQVLETAKEKFPNNTQVLFYLGTLYDSIGKKEEVISTMKEVVSIDPKHIQALNYAAYTWADRGQNLTEAEEYARRAVSLEPKDGYILDTLGWVLYKQGKYSEALQFLEAAHKLAPNVPIIAEHLGDVYVKQAMIEKAKGMYGRALETETEKDKVDAIQSKISSLNYSRDRQPAAAP